MEWVGVRMLLDTLQCTGQPHNGGRTEDTNGAAVEKRRSVAGRRRMLLVLMLSLLVLGLLPVGGSAWELCTWPKGWRSWLPPSSPGALDGQGPLDTATSYEDPACSCAVIPIHF